MTPPNKKVKYTVELTLPDNISAEVMSRLIQAELQSMSGRYSKEDSMFYMDRNSIKVKLNTPRKVK